MTSKFFTQHGIITSLVLSSFLLLSLMPLVASAATGTIKGYIFDDDTGATWSKDQATDSDGVWQPGLGEGTWEAVVVWVFDSTGIPKIVPSDPSGVWTATVEEGDDILVLIEADDSGLPQTYLATTPLIQFIDVDAGETVWADHFGYGPQY